ncbi:hypothetical protein ACIBO5_18645 [Nonomuraea angiospora]|uniref:hypothetical protein n=1 Tax=Nonomuraea angiospora TaxID=46172 RepID=UPI0029B46A20|nr:hypothetical protein [Nonomuraea angiospora]MDX3099762.1 hypothetical protein [Nonomuraea angiospora]
MTKPLFDEIIHAPNRLQICAMLAAVESGKAHRSTWLSLTGRGRDALAGHLAELRRIADLADPT